MQGGPKFNQLLPILFIRDLELEINFYKSFGFKLSYQGDEFPGFDILFSLRKLEKVKNTGKE